MYALKAIETKYHGPTNTRGSRHSARADGGHRIMVAAPHDLHGMVECHAYAARQLAEKLGWTGRWHVGGTKAGYVFVCVPSTAADDNSPLAFTVEEGEAAPAPAAPAYSGKYRSVNRSGRHGIPRPKDDVDLGGPVDGPAHAPGQE